MDIQTIRGFLHAHDETAVWDILKWLDEQNRAPLGQWDDAYEYFRGALTADMRAAAIETIMAECYAETKRVVMVWKKGEENVDLYGSVSFKSDDRWFVDIRPEAQNRRYSKSVIISDAHTLAALPIAIKRDLGDALAAEARRRVGEWWASRMFNEPHVAIGRDRRRTIESRIEAWSMVACSTVKSGTEAQAAQADFQRWAADQYARLCLGFLIGPARTR